MLFSLFNKFYKTSADGCFVVYITNYQINTVIKHRLLKGFMA